MTEKSVNYIQVRGDRESIKLSANNQVDDKYGDISFKILSCPSSSWFSIGNDNDVKLSSLRKGVEPWLTSLFQSEHLSLLTGTGLSLAVQSMVKENTSNPMNTPELSSFYSDKIKEAAIESAQKTGHGDTANIEDYIRVINDLLCGLRILQYDKFPDESAEKINYNGLNDDLQKTIINFVNEINKLENTIITADDPQKTIALGMLVKFLMSFASRTGTRDRLNVFTTNYDRVIELGAELAGIRLIDRFIGNLTPIFNSSRVDVDMHYNPPGIRGEPRYLEGVVRFTKLHGSIDWIENNGLIRKIGLPFGALDIKQFLCTSGLPVLPVSNVMIYPNASKDRETAEYPFVDLFRDFAATICRPNSTVITYGYGFGDDHINRVIRDMLNIPSTHLVIIAYSDVGNRIEKFVTSSNHISQISILVGKDIAGLQTLVDYFLPKPSIDKASIRMSDILKQRYSISKLDTSEDAPQ